MIHPAPPRRTRHLLGWLLATAATVAGIAGSGPAAASGPAQPGEPYPTAPGSDRKYCTTGPIVGSVVFSAGHCNVSSNPLSFGGFTVRDSTNLYQSDEQSSDIRYSHIAGPVSPNVAVRTDCPAILKRGESPQPGRCRQRGEDIPIAGVLQPWPGLTVQKAGATTGVSSGPHLSIVEYQHHDGHSFASYARAQGYACSGDSGSPTFARIGDRYYITGMLVAGNGSSTPDTPGGHHDKACYMHPDDPQRAFGLITIEQLCVELPTDSAERARCLAEAGRAVGDIDPPFIRGPQLTVSGWAFDPDQAAVPLARIVVTVDGDEVPFWRVTRPDDATQLHLAPTLRYGFVVTVNDLPVGVHEVCATFGNAPYTFGRDERTCLTATIT